MSSHNNSNNPSNENIQKLINEATKLPGCRLTLVSDAKSAHDIIVTSQVQQQPDGAFGIQFYETKLLRVSVVTGFTHAPTIVSGSQIQTFDIALQVNGIPSLCLGIHALGATLRQKGSVANFRLLRGQSLGGAVIVSQFRSVPPLATGSSEASALPFALASASLHGSHSSDAQICVVVDVRRDSVISSEFIPVRQGVVCDPQNSRPLPGDVLLAINDVPVVGTNLSEVHRLLSTLSATQVPITCCFGRPSGAYSVSQDSQSHAPKLYAHPTPLRIGNNAVVLAHCVEGAEVATAHMYNLAHKVHVSGVSGALQMRSRNCWAYSVPGDVGSPPTPASTTLRTAWERYTAVRRDFIRRNAVKHLYHTVVRQTDVARRKVFEAVKHANVHAPSAPLNFMSDQLSQLARRHELFLSILGPPIGRVMMPEPPAIAGNRLAIADQAMLLVRGVQARRALMKLIQGIVWQKTLEHRASVSTSAPKSQPAQRPTASKSTSRPVQTSDNSRNNETRSASRHNATALTTRVQAPKAPAVTLLKTRAIGEAYKMRWWMRSSTKNFGPRLLDVCYDPSSADENLSASFRKFASEHFLDSTEDTEISKQSLSSPLSLILNGVPSTLLRQMMSLEKFRIEPGITDSTNSYFATADSTLNGSVPSQNDNYNELSSLLLGSCTQEHMDTRNLYRRLCFKPETVLLLSRMVIKPRTAAILLAFGYEFQFLPGINASSHRVSDSFANAVASHLLRLRPALLKLRAEPLATADAVALKTIRKQQILSVVPGTVRTDRRVVVDHDSVSACACCGRWHLAASRLSLVIRRSDATGNKQRIDSAFSRRLCPSCSLAPIVQGLTAAQSIELSSEHAEIGVLAIVKELARLNLAAAGDNEQLEIFADDSRWLLPAWLRTWLILTGILYSDAVEISTNVLQTLSSVFSVKHETFGGVGELDEQDMSYISHLHALVKQFNSSDLNMASSQASSAPFISTEDGKMLWQRLRHCLCVDTTGTVSDTTHKSSELEPSHVLDWFKSVYSPSVTSTENVIDYFIHWSLEVSGSEQGHTSATSGLPTPGRVHPPWKQNDPDCVLATLNAERFVAKWPAAAALAPLAILIMRSLKPTFRERIYKFSAKCVAANRTVSNNGVVSALLPLPGCTNEQSVGADYAQVSLPIKQLWHIWDIQRVLSGAHSLLMNHGTFENNASSCWKAMEHAGNVGTATLQLYAMAARTAVEMFSSLDWRMQLHNGSKLDWPVNHGIWNGENETRALFSADVAVRATRRFRQRVLAGHLSRMQSHESMIQLADGTHMLGPEYHVNDSRNSQALTAPSLLHSDPHAAGPQVAAKSKNTSSQQEVTLDRASPEQIGTLLANLDPSTMKLKDLPILVYEVTRKYLRKTSVHFTNEQLGGLKQVLDEAFVSIRQSKCSRPRAVQRLMRASRDFCASAGVGLPLRRFQNLSSLIDAATGITDAENDPVPPDTRKREREVYSESEPKRQQLTHAAMTLTTNLEQFKSVLTSAAAIPFSGWAAGSVCVPTNRAIARRRRWNGHIALQILRACDVNLDFGTVSVAKRTKDAYTLPYQCSANSRPASMALNSSSADLTAAMVLYFAADAVGRGSAWPVQIATAISARVASMAGSSYRTNDALSAGVPDPFSIAAELVRKVDSLTGAGRYMYRSPRYLVPPPIGAVRAGTVLLDGSVEFKEVERRYRIQRPDKRRIDIYGFGEPANIINSKVYTKPYLHAGILKAINRPMSSQPNTWLSLANEVLEAQVTELWQKRTSKEFSILSNDDVSHEIAESRRKIWNVPTNCEAGWWVNVDAEKTSDSANVSKSRCIAPGCQRASRTFSKYCSSACGLLTATLRCSASTQLLAGLTSSENPQQTTMYERDSSRMSTMATESNGTNDWSESAPSTVQAGAGLLPEATAERIALMDALHKRLKGLHTLREVLNVHLDACLESDGVEKETAKDSACVATRLVQPQVPPTIPDPSLCLLDAPWNLRKQPRLHRFMWDSVEVAEKVDEISIRRKIFKSSTPRANNKRTKAGDANTPVPLVRSTRLKRQRSREQSMDKAETQGSTKRQQTAADAANATSTYTNRVANTNTAEPPKTVKAKTCFVANSAPLQLLVEVATQCRRWLRTYYTVLYIDPELDTGINSLSSRVRPSDSLTNAWLPHPDSTPCLEVRTRHWSVDLARSDASRAVCTCGFPSLATLLKACDTAKLNRLGVMNTQASTAAIRHGHDAAFSFVTSKADVTAQAASALTESQALNSSNREELLTASGISQYHHLTGKSVRSVRASGSASMSDISINSNLPPHVEAMLRLAMSPASTLKTPGNGTPSIVRSQESALYCLLRQKQITCPYRRYDCLAHSAWDQVIIRQIECEERRIATQLESVAVATLRSHATISKVNATS